MKPCFVALLFIGVLLSVSSVFATCQNECSQAGQKTCFGNYILRCDSENSCLVWNNIGNCFDSTYRCVNDGWCTQNRDNPEFNQGLTWSLSAWQGGGTGWITQPVLTVNNRQFRFNTPQKYISMLQNLQNQGAAGPISTYTSQFQAIVSTFNTQPACQQSGPVYSGWSACSSGTQTRTATYSNYGNVCNNQHQTTESQTCQQPVCQNSCSSEGQRTCSGNSISECTKDANSCLYWRNLGECLEANSCSNGYCLKPGATTPNCVDSDDGRNYNIQAQSYGTSSGISPLSANTKDTFVSVTESCVNSNTLLEYYCQNLKLYAENYYCPNGCRNGVCISSVVPTCNQILSYRGEWSGCSDSGIRNREITYENYGNVCGNTYTTSETESCSPIFCEQNFVGYSEWSQCIDGIRTRNKIYNNYNNICGNDDMEKERGGCSCVQETSYGDWSECINGRRTRMATYNNYQNVCGSFHRESQQELCSLSEEPTTEIINKEIKCPSDNTPVVFVHGYGSDESAFDEMDELFRKCGIKTYRDTTNSANPDLIETRAEILKYQIIGFKQKESVQKVNIIAHSMGGLISRYYIKYLGGGSSVKKLIMLGTPNHGSNLAVYDSENPKVVDSITSYDGTESEPNPNHITTQMMVESDFLSNLNSPTETYGYVGYYTIRGTLDSVVSLDSAKLTGVDGDKLVPCDHTLIKSVRSPTKCPESYGAVLEFLGGAIIKTIQSANEIDTGLNSITGEVVKEVDSRVNERVGEIEDVAVTTGRVVEVVVNEKDNSNFVDVVVGWFKSITRFLW